jgi:hypothetical protein
MDKLARILDLGFIKVGKWTIEGSELAFELLDSRNQTNVLYAFVSGRRVLYIGKSAQTVYRRMMGYRNPGPTQRTNIRNNASLVEILSEGSAVEIYVLSDDQSLDYGGFRIDLADGLENSLISRLRPEWNLLSLK